MILALMLPLQVFADEGVPFTLSRLVAELAPSDGVFESRYRQSIGSSLLEDSTEITGEIRYRLPGHFRKSEHGRETGQRVIEIDGATVRIRDQDGERTFLLDNAPTLEALMNSLRALASGDAEVLAQTFHASASGDWSGWALELESKASPSGTGGGKQGLEQPGRALEVVLEGSGRLIERIRIRPPRSARVTLELLHGEDSQ